MIKLKNWLRNSGLFNIQAPADTAVEEIKKTFLHEKRSFTYGFGKYLTDALYCHASPGVLETIIHELGDGHGKKLLNLGGGSGQVSKIFETLGYDVYNIDLIVEKEDDHNLRLDLNSTDLPFVENSFDAVVAQEIIEHLENPWRLLRNVKKVLNPEGKLIISTPNILSLKSRIKFLWSGYFPWFTPDCFEFHINPIPFWQLELIADQTGFQVKRIHGNGGYFFDQTESRLKKLLAKNEEIIATLKLKNDNR